VFVAVGVLTMMTVGYALKGRLCDEYWLWKLEAAANWEDRVSVLRQLAVRRSVRGLTYVLRQAAESAPQQVGQYFGYSPYSGIHVWQWAVEWDEVHERYHALIGCFVDLWGIEGMLEFAGQIALDPRKDLSIRAMAVDIVGGFHVAGMAEYREADYLLFARLLQSESALLRSTAAQVFPWVAGDPKTARRALEHLMSDKDATVRNAVGRAFNDLKYFESDSE
jgi:hypothetical protein